MTQQEKLKEKIHNLLEEEASRDMFEDKIDRVTDKLIDIFHQVPSELRQGLDDKVREFESYASLPKHQNPVSQEVIKTVLIELGKLKQIVEFENVK